MNKNVKIIGGVLFAILLFIFAKPARMAFYAFLNPKSRPWSIEYTKNVYKTVDSGFKATLTNDSQRAEATGCVIEKLKRKLPNGLELVPKDSLYQLSYTYSRECASDIKNAAADIKWTADAESEFRKGFIRNLGNNKMPLDVKNKICDCVLKELKSAYPRGLHLPLPDGQMEDLASKCFNNVRIQTDTLPGRPN